MKLELKQHFQIESARFLPHLDKSHPCHRMHGHSFKIILTLFGETHPDLGWVIDYNEVSEIMKPLLETLDHRVLNDIPGLEKPTSEHLCYWIFQKLKPRLSLLTAVSVQETQNTECTYKGETKA